MDNTPNYNLGGFGGDDGLWIFALLILLFGGGGFGFGNNGIGQQDLQRAIDLNSIQEGQAQIMSDIQRTNYETIATVKDAQYNNLSEIRDNGMSIANASAMAQKCCCDIEQKLLENRYLNAQNTAEINANTTAQTQKVLDALAQNKIEALQSKINALELQNAVAGVVRYPTAITYNGGISPFCSCGNPCCN